MMCVLGRSPQIEDEDPGEGEIEMACEITKADVQALENALAGGGSDWEIRTDYSGRGMFGKPCLAVVTDEPMMAVAMMAALIVESSERGDQTWGEGMLDASDAGAASLDSMGLSSVVYWPGLTVATDEVTD